MLRRELIFLHSASGDGCNDRPLLLATQEDFYRSVCIGSTRAAEPMTGHLTRSRFNRCIVGATSMLVLSGAVIFGVARWLVS